MLHLKKLLLRVADVPQQLIVEMQDAGSVSISGAPVIHGDVVIQLEATIRHLRKRLKELRSGREHPNIIQSIILMTSALTARPMALASQDQGLILTGAICIRVIRTRSRQVLLRKEVQTMAVVYATLIVKGKKTLEQVPPKLREEVVSPAKTRG